MSSDAICVKCDKEYVEANSVYELPCGHIIHRDCWDEIQRCPQCEASEVTSSSSEESDGLKEELLAVLEKGLPATRRAIAADPPVPFQRYISLDLRKASVNDLHVNLLRLSRTLEARLTAAEDTCQQLKVTAPGTEPVTASTTTVLRHQLKGPPKFPFGRGKAPIPLRKLRPERTPPLYAPPVIEKTYRAWDPPEKRVVMSSAEYSL
eukprot:TRINITY_DN10401_c0_g1_i1.p1 TRINITY_DN10401_c0_g1~~TRINITY_DN10401_c0_g1_i1.p1  ORF type:complete len:207 (+),score=34.30 TRINITY_DN10401_c0_g1_i1:97-717(+)